MKSLIEVCKVMHSFLSIKQREVVELRLLFQLVNFKNVVDTAVLY